MLLKTDIRTSQSKIIKENRFVYIVNDDEKTVSIKSAISASENIIIPEQILFNSQKYVITTILEGSFAYMMNIKTITFNNDSKLNKIDKYSFSYSSLEAITIPAHVTEIDDYAFFNCECLQKVEFSEPSELRTIGNSVFVNSKIESLCIPSHVRQLKEGWCCSTIKLYKVTIHQENRNYSIIKKKLVVGKINSKSENFDVLLFAPRDIQYVTIPTFIKRIDSYSFDRCNNLTKIEFLKDSELETIGRYAFSYSSFEMISIPAKVAQIEMNAFFNCKKLRKVEFSEKSEIERIGRFAFAHSSLESFVIPSAVKKIDEFAFSFCNNLHIIEIEDDSELASLDKKWFGYSIDIIIMVLNMMF